ncbi:MAG: hypothetical protein ACRD2C_15185 [Acidimicrobiales bacterium]
MDTTTRQMTGPTTLAAGAPRAAGILSGQPVDGSCGDTCGCATDATAAAGVSDGVPIACTLGAGEMPTRLEEWKALLTDEQGPLRGVTARHGLDDGVRLEFGPDTDVTEIARLAAAEQECCGFFSFAVVIDSRGIALEVHAPPDGRPVLDALFGLAS